MNQTTFHVNPWKESKEFQQCSSIPEKITRIWKARHIFKDNVIFERILPKGGNNIIVPVTHQ